MKKRPTGIATKIAARTTSPTTWSMVRRDRAVFANGADGRSAAQAACGRYCSQAVGIVGLATWMKISARGVRGTLRGCMPA